jgi:hypothetical protein
VRAKLQYLQGEVEKVIASAVAIQAKTFQDEVPALPKQLA